MRYCKSTIFQANHNWKSDQLIQFYVVCDTAKVRFFKQITTVFWFLNSFIELFAILQKYDFSSKSQPKLERQWETLCCLRYCKSTIFQANHNETGRYTSNPNVVCDTAKVRFFKQITTKHMPKQSNYTLFAILQKYDFSSKSQL